VVAYKLSNKLQNLLNLKGYDFRKMFTMRESRQIVFSSSILLSIKNKTKQTSYVSVLCIHHKQTNKQKTQNGPTVSQLKISSDLSNDCKFSPAFKKNCSSSELNKEFSPEEYRMAEKHLKKCSTSLIIRETMLFLNLSSWIKIQYNTILKFHNNRMRI
jgi:hypothetical protein